MAGDPAGDTLVVMDRTEVRGTLREMWDTRPARPRDGRKVGGVALAIARRYDIDPVLVRVAFAVTAFYGVGLLLYLAGMVVLPDAGDAEGARRGPRVHALVGLAVVGLLGVGIFFGSDGGLLLGVVALGMLFLLHRNRGALVPPASAGPAPGAPVSLVKEQAAPAEPLPPSWDPLGAAPFAWDLPEPGQAPPPPPERRLPVTAVTLSLALLAGGVTALLILATGAFSPSSVQILLGVLLAVLGAGLLTGSFLHTGRGLVPVALVVGLLTWGAVAAPLTTWPTGGYGDIRFAPATVAALEPTYRHQAGDVTLDLRGLDLSGTAPVATSVEVGAGEVRILVPRDTDVTFTGSAGIGRVAFPGQQSDGPGAELTVVEDRGADGVRSGPLLEITAEVGAGDVEVRRG
jgi:phage shock protein PspC (stress-responsive transcriptional regulator)